jgi:VWFA-related protein
MTIRALLTAVSGAILLAQTPSFRVATRLIQVNVIVTDRHGDPVTGLTKDKFEIFDQGRPQKIVFFTEQRPQPSAAPPRVGTGALVFSNRPDDRSEGSHSMTVVLFDRLNTRFEESAFAKARLEKFLSGVRPDDRIALYGLSSGLVVLHDFTDDAATLKRALDEFKPVESRETTVTTFKESNTGHPIMDFFNNKGDQVASDIYMTGRVGRTAAALEAIANHLIGISGRKSLVWVSSAFPMTIGYFQKRIMGANPQKGYFNADVERAGRALSNANVAIYPADAKGLATLTGGAFDASTSPNRIIYTVRPPAEQAPVIEIETMQNLAEATGGRIFINTNDIGGAVRRAIDDSLYTYTIAYYPDHDQWNGKFREIKMKVDRPGTEVRNRRGYLAVADTPTAGPPVSMDEIVRRPLPSTELAITAETEQIDQRQFKFHLRIDRSAMRFEPKDGRWDGQLEVLWVERAADGRDVMGHGQTLTFRLSPEAYAALPREGLKIASTETIDEKTVELRFAARDPGTGAAGSLYIPVRNLRKP